MRKILSLLAFIASVGSDAASNLETSFAPMDNGNGACIVEATITRNKKPVMSAEVSSDQRPLLQQGLERAIRDSCAICRKKIETAEIELRKRGIYFVESKCVLAGCFLGRGKISLEIDPLNFASLLDTKDETVFCKMK